MYEDTLAEKNSSYSVIELALQSYFLLEILSVFFWGASFSNITVQRLRWDIVFLKVSVFILFFSILNLLYTILINKLGKIFLDFWEHKASEISVSLFLFWSILIALNTEIWTIIVGLIFIAIAYIHYKSAWHPVPIIATAVLLVLAVDRFLRSDYTLPDVFSGIADLRFNLDFLMRLAIFASVLFVLFILLYFVNKFSLSRSKSEIAFRTSETLQRISPWFTLIVLVLSIGIIIWAQLYLFARIRTYSATTYDMGIFTQMFHSMNKNGLPLTTLERDFQMSHFKVHVSPIVYLLLPLFKLFPYAETIQLVQLLVVYLGVIPFMMLAKEYGLKSYQLGIWAAIFLLQPGFILANFYDFHENIFLTPLILFLFYFIKKGKTLWIYIFSILLLMVKEDAVVYEVSLAIYLFLTSFDKAKEALKAKKARRTAIIMLGLGLLVFASNIFYLRHFGTGDMSGRFRNLMFDDKLGLLSVPFTILFNPVYYLWTIFVPRKFLYLSIVLGSMGFLPLFNKRFSKLVLWLPLLAMNLSNNYPYQFEFNYQYSYGSHALLLIIALSVFSQIYRKESIVLANPDDNITPSQIDSSLPLRALSVSLSIFVAFSMNFNALLGKNFTLRYLFKPSQVISEANEILPQIPRDEIIWADSALTVPLADTEFLYDLYHHKYEEGEELPKYILVNKGNMKSYKDYVQGIIDKHYAKLPISGELIIVYELRNAD